MTILGLGEREQGKQQMQRQQQIPYGMTKKLRQKAEADFSAARLTMRL
jgi:hypothetical protein